MILPDDEILRYLRTIRHSPIDDRMARRIPSINDLAKRAGITRAAIYLTIRTGVVGGRSRQALSEAINMSMQRSG